MHKMADEVQACIGIPLLHVVDVVAATVKGHGLTIVGLLRTRLTMEEDFSLYVGRLGVSDRQDARAAGECRDQCRGQDEGRDSRPAAINQYAGKQVQQGEGD